MIVKNYILIVLVIIGGYSMLKPVEAESVKIPDSAIRLRVIPNSNSNYDQAMKQVVKSYLEEDVYNLTAAIFDNIDAITKENGKGAELSVENATSGMAAPFHKGAAKYYAEKGITVTAE